MHLYQLLIEPATINCQDTGDLLDTAKKCAAAIAVESPEAAASRRPASYDLLADSVP